MLRDTWIDKLKNLWYDINIDVKVYYVIQY